MNINENDLNKSNIIYFLKTTYGKDKYRDLIDIYASSNENSGVNDQALIDCIFDDSDERWVSKEEVSPNFTIIFTLGEIYLQSYAFKWSAGFRYNNAWIVEGYSNSQWNAIDLRNEQNLCSDHTGCLCSVSHETLLVLRNPGYYTKLRFTANQVDSCGQNYFSMTQILLFGQYHHKVITKLKGYNLISIVFLFLLVLS